MKSIRLNRDHKEGILSAMMNDTFKDRTEEFNKRKVKLADAVYKDQFTKSELETLSNIPDGWLTKEEYLSVRFAGERYGCSLKMSKAMPIPRWLQIRSLKYEVGHKLHTEHEKLTQDQARYADEKQTAKIKLAAMLDSFTTTKKLLASWPEIEKYVVRVVGTETQPIGTDLVPVIADLNKTFKLGA